MEPRSGPLIVAMKGHPGTGKSTLARRLATTLHCPLLDKDDIRDCTLPLQSSSANAAALNDLSYAVLWRTAETQLALAGLDAVVVDSPLSSRRHLDRLEEVAGRVRGRVVVVECTAGDEAEWQRRVERRGEAIRAAEGGTGDGWHKPATWEELRRLVDGYGGRADYDVGEVARLVVDTTAPAAEEGGGFEGLVRRVLEFIRSN